MTENDTYPELQPIPFQYEIAILGEECGEVVQMVGKIMRFGIESYDPADKDRRTNHQLLHDEVGDILAAIEFATDRGFLDSETLLTRKFNKRKKLHAMAPGPLLAVGTPIAEAPRKSKTTAIVVLGMLLALAAVFYIGRESNNILTTKVAAAASACYDKYHDARCNDMADLVK